MIDRASMNWERAFRSLFWRLRPNDLQAQVAAAVSDSVRGIAGAVYQRIRQQVIDQLIWRRFDSRNAASTRSRLARREQFVRLLERSIPNPPSADDPDFHCDAGLGGLARWLRAMGYDAWFWPGIDDAELITKLIGSTAILLSTDSRLMHHGAIAHGAIAALLVPVTQSMRGQLEFVAAALSLPTRPPRCMACGGELLSVEKESVRDRIPPRTYPWRDDYFVCARCNRLFWKGSHWQRIGQQLGSIAPDARAEHVG